MAEILGLVSSVITVVGVAGKLGTSTFKLKRLWGEVQDAPASIQQCIEQLEILAPAIQEMESEFERTREMVQNDTAAKTSLEYSRKAMETLEALVKDMECQIGSARRSKKLVTQLKVRLRRDVLDEHQRRLQFALQLVSLSQQTYLIALTRAQPSIIMSGLRALQGQSDAQSDRVQRLDSDSDSGASTIAPRPNQAPKHGTWWPNFRIMPWRNAGLLGSFTYEVGEEAVERGSNARVYQARLQLPRWLLQKAWDLQCYRAYDGWKFQLRNWNVRPNDSPIFKFIKDDRTDLVLEALSRNEASLCDLDEQGRTLIEMSMLNGRLGLLKELHQLGLTASNIDLHSFFAQMTVWYWYESDHAVEASAVCELGEAVRGQLEFDEEQWNPLDNDWLALLMVSGLMLEVLPHETTTHILAYGVDWTSVDPAILLKMIAQGSITPTFLRQAGPFWTKDIEWFAWRYFHALLNGHELELWRPLAREIFAGASAEDVALLPYDPPHHLPLLCGVLDKINWRCLPMGAFSKWLPKALLVWMEDLAGAGVNLQEYMRAEISACRGEAIQLRQETRLAGSRPSAVVLSYGDDPQDWVFEWDACVEESAGDFWSLIESPPMPGAWVDDDGDDGDFGYRCYMGDDSISCRLMLRRCWRDGAKRGSLGVQALPRCQSRLFKAV